MAHDAFLFAPITDPLGHENFDRLLEPAARVASAIHWTPTDVIHRVIELFELTPGERVLDVGCGVGKVCLIGSLLSEGVFVGVEQRLGLVEQARRVAKHLDIRAEFIHGDAFDIEWAGFEALYFYNPFGEARFDADRRIDDEIPLGEQVFHQNVRRAYERLLTLAPGTRVVTFHGIGGPMPASFELHSAELAAGGSLKLWVQTASGATDQDFGS